MNALDWIKTPRRSRNTVARVTAWHTRDRRYRLELHRYDVSLPPAWFALVAEGAGYRIVSRHRKKAAAVRACLRHRLAVCASRPPSPRRRSTNPRPAAIAAAGSNDVEYAREIRGRGSEVRTPGPRP